MSTITSSPFSLAQNTLIQARISAINSIGTGTPSSLNSEGTLAQLAPHKPPEMPFRHESTTKEALVVNYPTLIDNFTGGSTILSLNLQWDFGTSGAEWRTLIGESPYNT